MKKSDKDLKDALTIFGKEYVAELGRQLLKEDKKASGNLIKSLDSRVIKTAMGTLYTIELKAEKYLKYVDQGRKTGTYPPLNAIRKWVKLKGISEHAVFPIMRKIKEEGIKPTNVLRKTLKKLETGIKYRNMEQGMADWTDALIGDLMLDLSKNKNQNITVRNK